MDRAMQLRHLKEAERHIAQGKRHIFEQEGRIGFMVRQGYDTGEARKLLDNFKASQMQHL
ncbi:hypothetical protein ACM43_11860 [Bradyrhizobium sp. CCBAU 45321]|nr:hypothetical protein [Bradyrhizobium sp. CCBAU 45321]